MKDTVIVGVCATGRVVLDCLLAAGRAGEVLGFFDSQTQGTSHEAQYDGFPVVRSLDAQGVRRAVVALGENARRREICEDLKRKGIELVSAVHPSATVTRGVTMGVNVIVGPGAVVGVGSKLGDGVLLNTSCSVDHDCDIGEFASICPGAHLAGTVTVGRQAWVGIGASVVQGLTIGEDTFVGAGAVVVKDLPAGVLACGCPARVVRELADEERGRIIT